MRSQALQHRGEGEFGIDSSYLLEAHTNLVPSETHTTLDAYAVHRSLCPVRHRAEQTVACRSPRLVVMSTFLCATRFRWQTTPHLHSDLSGGMFSQYDKHGNMIAHQTLGL